MKFSNEHEWITVDGDIGTVGLSKYAVDELGDITFVELPEVGKQISKDDSAAFLESVKAASDIYTPVSGEVSEVNEKLLDSPELLNEDSQTNWIFKLKLSSSSELDSLMSEDEYNNFIKDL